MSREIALEAIGTALLNFDGRDLLRSQVEYKRLWFQDFMSENADEVQGATAGRLILGCSSTPLKWIYEAKHKIDPQSGRVFATSDGDIFGEPDVLQEVILKYWHEWHEEDDRWGWSRQTVVDFFRLHTWAIVYIWVY